MIIGFSGKKASGKSSIAKFAMCVFANKKEGYQRFVLMEDEGVTKIYDAKESKEFIVDIPNDDTEYLKETYNIGFYSFADPLKNFCINVLGLDHQQCYGSNADKNSRTHIQWSSIPDSIREKYSRPKRGVGGIYPASGKMTGREILEVFGTHICREMDTNCWARSLYTQLSNCDDELSLVSDVRFPNEVTMGTEIGAKIFRLTRNPFNADTEPEVALDDFPLGEYTGIVDNSNTTMAETHKWFFDNYLEKIFR